jgi:phenylacetate-CoA ligase
MFQVLSRWASLQRSQWKSKDELARIQLAELNKTIDHAYRRVPFYHRLYDSAHVAPSSITELDSIGRLPVVKKSYFRETPLQDRTASDTDIRACLPLSTSGSTGPRVSVLEDPHSAAYRDALNLRFLWAYGVRPGDRVCSVTLNPAGGTGPYLRLADRCGLYGFLRRNLSKQVSLATDIQNHAQFFSAERPDVIIAPPSYYTALARFCENAGKHLTFRIVVSSYEMLDHSTRRLIEDKFEAEVFDHYGTEEAGPLAWECPTHSGYHINGDSLIMEFLRDGEPVANGEPGEVHVTSFHRQATPVIRYFTDDIAVPVSGDCQCGRNLPMLRNIEGRIEDFILTTDGRYISPLVVVYCLWSLITRGQYRIIQESDLSIRILVKKIEGRTGQVLKEIEQRCRELFGETPLTLELVDRIEEKDRFHLVESRAFDRL